MRRRIAIHCAAAALLIAANAFAGNLVVTDRTTKELSLQIAGSFWIDNPVGDIEIVGADAPDVAVTVLRTTRAVDRAALNEGREQTVISFEGDHNVRFIRTIVPAMRSDRWESSVSYTVRVPRTVHVKVAAKMGGRIRVANIIGNVTINTFNGNVILDGVTGASVIDIINGKVLYQYRQKPMAHAKIEAVNADIEVHVPADSNFNWIADTLRGDVLTNLPVRAEYVGTAFRGTINAPGGPTLTTQTLLGSIRLLGNELNTRVRSLHNQQVERTPGPAVLISPSLPKVQLPISGGPFIYSVAVADISVGEVHGLARVDTGAGEIELGVVWGDCQVVSLGGPLNLGDIMGSLFARTGAGDVLVRAAREGGRVSTVGGTIRVLYTGGPTVLESGGGDIIVRQAAGPINAETRSGDINITADPSQKTQKIAARTSQGNIIINVSPRFAADIDATVLTTDADANAIHSDFSGLSIKREQVGNKTRIHATGKLNGGGERLELYAVDGNIHIINMTTNPVTVMSPLQ